MASTKCHSLCIPWLTDWLWLWNCGKTGKCMYNSAVLCNSHTEILRIYETNICHTYSTPSTTINHHQPNRGLHGKTHEWKKRSETREKNWQCDTLLLLRFQHESTNHSSVTMDSRIFLAHLEVLYFIKWNVYVLDIYVAGESKMSSKKKNNTKCVPIVSFITQRRYSTERW